MVRLFVRHKVQDYSGWRKVYDDFDTTRKGMGVTAQAVYRNVTDEDDVTVTHDFESVEEAQAFVESSQLHDAMSKAHVAGPPEIWITLIS